jgi:predicted O-linked N-acetylglucosamine transferase (SPINDLY family)
MLLAMIYTASVSPEELAESSREFGRRFADPLLRTRELIRDKSPDRKLRIGYVSPDFKNHAVNYFFENLLDQHNRNDFEIYAYSNTKKEDFVTDRLKKKFDYWRDISGMNDDKAADKIESDLIDILVDIAGHTGGNRLLVFARKPAPIQVTWLGYPATTGIKAIDYRISDYYTEPKGMTEHLNTETLWRLPQIFCCYGANERSPKVIDHPPFEDNGYITFGCFNNFSKVTDPVLETWRKILEQVPDSRLMLEIAGADGSKFKTQLNERFKRLGIPEDRIIVIPRHPSNQFVLYNKIDVALDPFPCAGGTTSMDTMWMGVPLITLAGHHFVSRMGVTILNNVGLSELVCENTDEYVFKAIALGNEHNRLRSMRHNLREKVMASPMMDQVAFAKNMEDSYRQMWQKYCATN